jgi:hypothetical protein
MSQPIDSKILRTLQREIKQSLKGALEKLRISFLFASLILMLSPAAMATEGGGTSKALGVDTVLAGVMPPPGASAPLNCDRTTLTDRKLSRFLYCWRTSGQFGQ